MLSDKSSTSAFVNDFINVLMVEDCIRNSCPKILQINPKQVIANAMIPPAAEKPPEFSFDFELLPCRFLKMIATKKTQQIIETKSEAIPKVLP